MSAELIPFPPAPLPPHAIQGHAVTHLSARRGGIATRRYRLADLVRLLALEDLTQRTQIDRLRLLARKCGLPLPLNPRQRAGAIVTGPRAICAASVWDAAQVDAWLHQPGPLAPASLCAAAGSAAPSSIDLHGEMRARAARLTR